jgi:rhomboid protease GluP
MSDFDSQGSRRAGEAHAPDPQFDELLQRLGAEGAPPAPAQQRVALELFQPRAAWALIIINVAVYLAPLVLGLQGVVQDAGVKSNAAIQAGEYYRLLTATFLHADLTHLGFNMLAIYMFGRDVERVYGTPRFLAVYLLAGLGGSVASYLGSPNDALGASGAVFGLISALGIFFVRARAIFGEMSRQQIGSLLFIVLINLAFGFTTPRIDNYGHLGGLFVGALAALLLAPQLVIDRSSMPPALVRRSLPFAWPGAAALLALCMAVVWLVPPALR